MRQAIGIRLPKEVLKQVEKLSKEESEDRSTIIRRLVILGYNDFIQKRYAEEYMKGRLTLSEAAYRAGLTVWEMESYLVEHGFKSSYSIEDLRKELKILNI